jgi:hypothetical protein
MWPSEQWRFYPVLKLIEERCLLLKCSIFPGRTSLNPTHAVSESEAISDSPRSDSFPNPSAPATVNFGVNSEGWHLHLRVRACWSFHPSRFAQDNIIPGYFVLCARTSGVGIKQPTALRAGGEICNIKYSSTVAQAQKGANLNCRLITRLSPTLCPAATGVYLLEKQSGRTLHTYAFLANGLTLSLTRAPRKHSRIANLDTSRRLSERIKVDARVNARRVSVSERKEAENE